MFDVLCLWYTLFSAEAEQRRFPYKKYQPEQCHETRMINYLLDCYEQVNVEERMAPKVDKTLQLVIAEHIKDLLL